MKNKKNEIKTNDCKIYLVEEETNEQIIDYLKFSYEMRELERQLVDFIHGFDRKRRRIDKYMDDICHSVNQTYI